MNHIQLTITKASFITKNGSRFQQFDMVDADGYTYTAFRDASLKEFLKSHSEFYALLAKSMLTVNPELAELFEQVSESDKALAEQF